ncbi:MAG: hypothetical protein MMC33_000488 [Icmadophila ericetorum]|nr:hypothetical protein [Icmadophila ericetorum]
MPPKAPPTYTNEQRDELFQVELRMKRLEEDKARKDLEAMDALQRRLDVESAARVEAIRAGNSPVNGAGGTGNRSMGGANQAQVDNDSLGELPPEVASLASRKPSLPRTEIAKIYLNKFKPEDLHKLRPLASRHDDSDRTFIISDDGTLRATKRDRTYRDFGQTSTVWSEGFLNYAMIMNVFHGVKFPRLIEAILGFHAKIMLLAGIYQWRQVVLLLAVDTHTDITHDTITDSTKWILDKDIIDQYCSPSFVISAPAPALARKRSVTTHDPNHKKKREKSGKELCLNFNTEGGCRRIGCKFEQSCEECGSEDHVKFKCKKR